jgi:hypothetical protein
MRIIFCGIIAVAASIFPLMPRPLVAQDSQGFRVESIDAFSQKPFSRKSELARTIVRDVRPADLEKRLTIENIQSEYALSTKIFDNFGGSKASILRNLFTSSSSEKIQSSLAGNDITARVDQLLPAEKSRLVGTLPNIDGYSLFNTNLDRVLKADASISGFLRVWEGAPVEKPDLYLDTVLILGSNKICTGILVTPDKVLTAAHCYCSGVDREVVIGTTILDYITRLEIDKPKSRSFIDCEALNNDLSNISKGDVAVYTLRSPMNDVAPRRIASENFVRAAASVRAVGFGKTSSAMFGSKFTVDIVIASHDCTEPAIQSGGPYGCTSGAEMIAAGMNRDTCGGDSGGPIYVLGQDVNLYLAGVTSRGVDPHGGCGEGGIYVKLTNSRIREWLNAQGIPKTAFSE